MRRRAGWGRRAPPRPPGQWRRAGSPWSAGLGVATVPELFTAALTVLAMAALAPAAGRGERRILGGAALLAATLSRYEAWPVALMFAGICLVEAARSGGHRASLL